MSITAFLSAFQQCARMTASAMAAILLLAAVRHTGQPPTALAQINSSDAVCVQNPTGPISQGPASGTIVTQLATDRPVYGAGEPVTLIFTITNVSAVPVTVTFANSPPPDFRLRIDSATDGRTVWSYPAGPALPLLSQCTFAPGETYDLTQVWDQQQRDENGAVSGPALASDYVLNGNLAVVCLSRDCELPSAPEAVLFQILPAPMQPAAAPAPATLVELCSAGTAISNSYYSYPAGYNLVGGPEGRVLVGATALYGYDPASMTFTVLPPDSPLELGAGYVAYFPNPMTGPTPPGTSRTYTVLLPAGKYVLVGNPRPSLVSVQGADIVYTYDPTAGYAAATVLRPGQGAWAYSAAGGTLTITDISRCTYPSGLPLDRSR